MALRNLSRRMVVAHARPEAFAPSARSILGRLGYQILTVDEYAAVAAQGDAAEPPEIDLRIADERRLGELVEEPGERPSPVILLTGRHGVTGADSRVVGAIPRPAGLHELYRLMQQVLEENPRATPRVATHLVSRCRREGREWHGAVLSLSENGCLLRSAEPLPLGTQLELCFDLPGSGPIEVTADTAYQLVPDLGLVFNAIAAQQRSAIQGYVSALLA